MDLYVLKISETACLVLAKQELWILNKIEHRTFLPSIIINKEYYAWRQKDKFHRFDGPAIINLGIGMLNWYRDGRLHREDGPAVVHSSGEVIWYRYGRALSRDEILKLNLGNQDWKAECYFYIEQALNLKEMKNESVYP